MRYEIVSQRPDLSWTRIGPLSRERAVAGAVLALQRRDPRTVWETLVEGDVLRVTDGVTERSVMPRDCKRPARSLLPPELAYLEDRDFIGHPYTMADYYYDDGYLFGSPIGQLTTGELVVPFEPVDDGDEGTYAGWTVIPEDPRP